MRGNPQGFAYASQFNQLKGKSARGLVWQMNEKLLSSVLKQPSSGLLKSPDRKTPAWDDGICPQGFAERVINHFGRQIPVTETAKPILQTSQTEQVRIPNTNLQQLVTLGHSWSLNPPDKPD